MSQPWVPGPCFPAGTQIDMVGGSRTPIESVVVGSVVRTAEGNVGAVVATSKRPFDGALCGIDTGGEFVLWGTPEHPVLTATGYLPISELKPGDRVRLTCKGEWATLAQVGRRPFSGDVYNIQVAGDESYVANGVGVHNCPIYVGLGSAFSPLFLGFSERGVSIDFNPTYSPYVVDFAGSVPLDYSYQGTDCTFSFELANFNENVYALMSDYAGVVNGSVRGVDLFGEIGTLMGFEGAAYPVWLPFPYVAKAAYSTGIAGYHFYACFIDRDALPERGAKPAKTNITMRAIRKVGTTSTSGEIGSSFSFLYDHDMSAVAGLVFDLD